MGLFKSDEEKIKEYIQDGLNYANKNEFEKAIKEFEKALKIDSKNQEALFNLGFVYSDMGDSANAYEIFKKLINLNPNYIEAFNQLGLVFAKQGKFTDSVFVFEKGIEHNPEAALLYNNLGNVYFEYGNYEKAYQCFKKAGELDPVFAERLYHLGISHLTTSTSDEIIAKLEDAAKKNANKAKVAHDLGVAYAGKHMYDKAIEAFNKALSIDPNYLSAYENLGYAYQYKEMFDYAIKAFEKALTLNPKSAKLYNTIGLLYDKIEKPDIAVKAYKKAVTLDPTYANSHYMLGQLYQNRGNIDKAVAEFTKHIRIHERGELVEDAMQRIAEMKNMTFEQIKELFDQYIEEKPEPDKLKTPAPQMEERNMKDYMKELKERMAKTLKLQQKSHTEPSEPIKILHTTLSVPSPETTEKKVTATDIPKQEIKPIDPQEYLKKMKEKIKKKKEEPSYPETGIEKEIPTISQSDIRQQPDIEIQLPPAPEHTKIETPKSPPDITQPIAEPTIMPIDEEIPVVSFDEPKETKISRPIFNQPQSANTYIPDDSSTMETIIKPVGQNIKLPTDKMPEFREQPKPPDTNLRKKQQSQSKPDKKNSDDESPPPTSKIKHTYY